MRKIRSLEIFLFVIMEGRKKDNFLVVIRGKKEKMVEDEEGVRFS